MATKTTKRTEERLVSARGLYTEIDGIRIKLAPPPKIPAERAKRIRDAVKAFYAEKKKG